MLLLWAWSGDEGPAMSTAVDIVVLGFVLERLRDRASVLLQPNALARVPIPILCSSVLERFTGPAALSCQNHDKVIK